MRTWRARTPTLGACSKRSFRLWWVIGALRIFYAGSMAQGMYAGVMTSSTFEIGRGIKKWCPSSGSVWALIFDPAVRVLRASMAGPREELSLSSRAQYRGGAPRGDLSPSCPPSTRSVSPPGWRSSDGLPALHFCAHWTPRAVAQMVVARLVVFLGGAHRPGGPYLWDSTLAE